MNEEERNRLTTQAILEFSLKFSEYVKEMDPELWKRAVDYAKDWTRVDGVSFRYVEDDKDEDTGTQ